MNAQAPGVFESFNARVLRPEQVAKTFVAPSFFRLLAARCHSTIVGPRGSGKTSLLKMLQPRALESWNANDADEIRDIVDFTGIFIPTDITWSRQTTASVENLPDDLARAFRGAAFTTAVLHSLIETLAWRTASPEQDGRAAFRRVTLTPLDETALVRELAATWSLAPSTDSLIGLKHSLSRRNTDIWSIAYNSVLTDKTHPPEWLGLEFLSCVNQAVEMFDDLVGETDSRWALLFDELELAPNWVTDGLLAALRSTYPRLLFKLALSPFDEQSERVRDALNAAPLQDYNEIALWHAKKEDGREFSNRLFLNICKDQGILVGSLEEILGASPFDGGRTSNPSYGKGGAAWKALKQAIANDPTFAEYWRAQQIDIDNLPALPENERAAKVRKIFPLALLRNHFRPLPESRQAKKQKRKGRKTIEIYKGASSILAIAEGNPRWIIGISRLLLASTQQEGQRLIPAARQASVIEDTVHKFRVRLKTMSVGNSSRPEQMSTLLSLIDSVGTFFREGIIDGDFNSQPYLTFTVDAHTPSDLVVGIGRALNAGAIVYVPDPDSLALLHSLRGKRFRLSYLLAPYFHLPLRLGESVSLARILSANSVAGEPAMQLELHG